MRLALAKEFPPPRGIPILAQIEFLRLGNLLTERIVCIIDSEGSDDLYTEGGDDIGWPGEVIVAWAPLPDLQPVS